MRSRRFSCSISTVQNSNYTKNAAPLHTPPHSPGRSADRSALLSFAREIVGTLNETILNIVDRKVLLVCALNGPVTGGSIGLMLACDHVIASDTAFAQPYYARMGFAPDGGWTAI